jgi:hypothetical protein
LAKFLRSVAAFIADECGYPASLYHALDTTKQFYTEFTTPPPNVSAENIVSWHEWGTQDGRLSGWRDLGGNYYGCFDIHYPKLAQFAIREEIPFWSCDIQDVVGLLFSKSNLDRFTSLDDLVETNSQEMIADISIEGMEKNLAHDEIRIIHQTPSSDHFAHYAWDGRVFLMNGGGSHHFSAARYIAARLQHPIPLTGRLCTYRINPAAVAGLRNDFSMFALAGEAFSAFHRAMDRLRATFFVLKMPDPYVHHCYAVLLPRNEPRSRRAAKALSEAGVFDLGEHLGDLVARQATQHVRPSMAKGTQLLSCRPGGY